jgi:hypothetical protein
MYLNLHNAHCAPTTSTRKSSQHRRTECISARQNTPSKWLAGTTALRKDIADAFAMITHATAWSTALTPLPKPQPAHKPMPSVVNMLLPHRSLRALIAGLVLTHEQAESLLGITKSAQTLLRQQISAINAMGMHDTDSSIYLRSVQERESSLQNTLKTLIASTKTSTAIWLHEIEDLLRAIIRKVSRCNRKSHSNHMGWRLAAATYWPLIAESYDFMVPLLIRLGTELEAAINDGGLWAASASCGGLSGIFKPATTSLATSLAVTFSKEVQFRCITLVYDEPVSVKDCTVQLTTDCKRTARRRRAQLPPGLWGW